MEYGLKKNLKRYLKRKVKITLELVVTFLITGIVGYSETIDKTVEIKLENGNIVVMPDGAGKLEENTWTNDDTIDVQNGNGVSISNNVINKDFNIVNNGSISGNENGNNLGNGIYNNSGIITSIINTGIISGNGSGSGSYSGNGIYNNSGIITSIINTGIISGNENGSNSSNGIYNNSGTITNIINTGIISGNGSGSYSGNGIYNESGTIESIINSGVISGNGSGYDSGNGIYNNPITSIINSGVISGNGSGYTSGNGIYNNNGTITSIINTGVISGSESESVSGNNSNNGIYNYLKPITSIINTGIISGSESISGSYSGNGICNIVGKIGSITNHGIIAGSDEAIKGVSENNITNLGLLIDNTGKNNQTIKAGAGGKDTDSGKYIINGVVFSGDKADAKAVNSSELADKKDNLIINVVGDTNTAFNIDDNLTISNSTINGYKNVVVFNGKDKIFTGTNVIVNAGENAFTGSTDGDTLILSENSVINGKVDLGAGDDTLTLSNTVKLNKEIIGGDGSDTLTFNSSSAKSTSNNMNILHNISNFENINVNNNITLFEKVKVTGAENITIGENGNLVLRIDGTDNNSHALKDNTGVISSTGGKLLFALNGVGEGTIIDLGSNSLDETMKGNEIGYAEDITLDTTSLLHNIKKESESSVKVETVENLPEKDIPENINYDKLNKIYQSIRSVDKVGEFNVDGEDKLTAFTKYLHDIYAGNPYAYSSELSRKTMGMMRNLADKDLNPELNKWTIYGGFTHTDSGTENSYYGKGYYTYDIGSRDISADTKISGGYFKAEYGKTQNLTTGIIFGGNNSETEIGASKVEGDSFYFGAYAKKYLNNFRFTLGAGFEHGDYKADRTAVGYEGIIDTRKYSENYNDRGFDIYGDIKYSKEIGNNLFFEPSFMLSYTYLDQDGAKDESGVLAIETDSKNFDYASGELNLDLRKEIKKDKFTHSLTAGVSYERMLSGYDEEYITGRVKGGTDFDILVPEKEKDIFSLNAKYELETEKGILFDVKGSYKFKHNTNQNEWIVGTGIGYRF